MEKPTIEEDTDVGLQTTQVLTGEDSNISKVTAAVAVKKEHELEVNEKDMEQQEGERATGLIRKRAQKKKFDKIINKSKSLLIMNAMHEEASEEDKAWLASLTEVEVDMLISIKQMAMERAKMIQDERVHGIFNFKVLRAIALLLKEFIKERLKNSHFPAEVFETQSNPPENNERMLPIEREGECNDIKPIVKSELEGMAETNDMKRKRASSCEQEEIYLKKQKRTSHGTEQVEF